MGKGDKKTAKGKRTMGSYGITRKRKSNKPAAPVATAKKEVVKEEKAEKKPTKKASSKKTEA